MTCINVEGKESGGLLVMLNGWISGPKNRNEQKTRLPLKRPPLHTPSRTPLLCQERSGHWLIYGSPAAAALPETPEVTHARCKPGNRSIVLHCNVLIRILQRNNNKIFFVVLTSGDTCWFFEYCVYQNLYQNLPNAPIGKKSEFVSLSFAFSVSIYIRSRFI